jgi:amidase
MIWLDAIEQAQAIRRKEVSSLELTKEYLQRIDRLDPSLRSFVAVDNDAALAASEGADAQILSDHESAGPLHGVPISVKDVIAVAGLATTHSSKALVRNVSRLDDPLVQRFRQAGLVVLGKTNVPEFCTSMTTSELNGICRNPWDLDRTPGGSSGGAAAALAAGLCSVSHGTDGAGSVRIPAAFCGLVGVKPTRGLISFGPEIGPAYFGTSGPGVLTHSVRDAAAMLDVMVGTGQSAPAWSPGAARSYGAESMQTPERLRIAVSTTPPFGAIESECGDVAVGIGRVLEGLGHHVESATPNWSVILQAAFGPMEVPGPSALIGPESYDLVEPRNRPMIERLTALTVAEHAQWVELTRQCSLEFLTFWDHYDVLVSPTSGMVPPLVDWAPWDQTPDDHMANFASFPSFAQPFNLSGQPALSLPLGWSETGLPIGVQVAGRRLSEVTLLQLAAQLEMAVPWSSMHPPFALE